MKFLTDKVRRLDSGWPSLGRLPGSLNEDNREENDLRSQTMEAAKVLLFDLF